jgi:hypothetical protein
MQSTNRDFTEEPHMNAVRKTLRSCIGLFLLLVIITVATSVPLHAQDGEAAPDAAAADADTTAPQPTQNQLYWIIHTSGWIGGVLLLISFYFVAIIPGVAGTSDRTAGTSG